MLWIVVLVVVYSQVLQHQQPYSILHITEHVGGILLRDINQQYLVDSDQFISTLQLPVCLQY